MERDHKELPKILSLQEVMEEAKKELAEAFAFAPKELERKKGKKAKLRLIRPEINYVNKSVR